MFNDSRNLLKSQGFRARLAKKAYFRLFFDYCTSYYPTVFKASDAVGTFSLLASAPLDEREEEDTTPNTANVLVFTRRQGGRHILLHG